MIQLHLRQPAFDNFVSGAKKYEGRVARGMITSLRLQDYINLVCGARYLPCRLTEIHRYDNFRSALTDLDYRQIIPQANSMDDALNHYRTIYDPEMEQIFGVLLFKLDLI